MKTAKDTSSRFFGLFDTQVMKNIRTLSFYISTLVVFAILVYWIVIHGQAQEAGKHISATPLQTVSDGEHFIDTVHHNLTHPLAILLLQIITIITTARIFGYIFTKIGQPTVIGEIIAGIFLGPSFLGMFFPEYSTFLFPVKSLGNLQFLSQIGLILFMFVIGMELDLRILRNKAREAVVISHASIIFPFALGMTLAYFMYLQFAPAGINFLSFALFLGIAMSITAFPVLARIVQERGLTKTRIGVVVITCAATDDITAWCILAAVIAIVKAGSFLSAFYTILLALAYVLFMLKVIQPFLKKLGHIYADREILSKPIVAIFFVTLLISSYATEIIGIHALFGAFMAGVIMPPNFRFRNIFIEKVEDVSLVLLLPLFFVFTGLRTQIGLLNEAHLWGICGMITLVAVIGKFAGSSLAARFMGQSWKDSLIIGALMNTRGLMELVVLNIGYDLGILSPEVFAMFVIMALATTLMTGPALDLLNKFNETNDKPVTDKPVSQEKPKFRILIPFGNPQRGTAMLQMANHFIRKNQDNSHITALHLSPGNELHQYNEEEYEKEYCGPIEAEAKRLDVDIDMIFRPARDIDKEITDIANKGNFNLMIIGTGESVFEESLLGNILRVTNGIINPEKIVNALTGKEKLLESTIFDERTQKLIRNSKIPVGIFFDKNLTSLKSVFIPVFTISDSSLLIYAQKLIRNSNTQVIVMDMTGVISQNPEIRESIRNIEQNMPNHISIKEESQAGQEMLSRQDLMLISLDSWKQFAKSHNKWIDELNSVLIIKS